MKKFKNKALKKKSKAPVVVSDDETEEEAKATKEALKKAPKSTADNDKDSDGELAEDSEKSSDAAEFSDGEYIPAKKVVNDEESEDDLKAKMEIKEDGTTKSAFKKMKKQKKLKSKEVFEKDPVSGEDSDDVVAKKYRTPVFEHADEYDHYAKFNHMSRKQALK